MKLSNKLTTGAVERVLEVEGSIEELNSKTIVDILKYNSILRDDECKDSENVYDYDKHYDKNRIIFNALKDIGIFNEDDKIKSFTLKCDVEEYPVISVEYFG